MLVNQNTANIYLSMICVIQIYIIRHLKENLKGDFSPLSKIKDLTGLTRGIELWFTLLVTKKFLVGL